MTRAANADAVVAKHLAAWSSREMVWGVDDCMLAVADIVREARGKDPARRFRGTYTSRLGARKALGKGGTEKAARDSARALHWRRIAPGDAKAGDVGLMPVLIQRRGGARVEHVAMACRAPGWFVGRTERGFMAFPADKIAIAWAT